MASLKIIQYKHQASKRARTDNTCLKAKPPQKSQCSKEQPELGFPPLASQISPLSQVAGTFENFNRSFYGETTMLDTSRVQVGACGEEICGLPYTRDEIDSIIQEVCAASTDGTDDTLPETSPVVEKTDIDEKSCAAQELVSPIENSGGTDSKRPAESPLSKFQPDGYIPIAHLGKVITHHKSCSEKPEVQSSGRLSIDSLEFLDNSISSGDSAGSDQVALDSRQSDRAISIGSPIIFNNDISSSSSVALDKTTFEDGQLDHAVIDLGGNCDGNGFGGSPKNNISETETLCTPAQVALASTHKTISVREDALNGLSKKDDAEAILSGSVYLQDMPLVCPPMNADNIQRIIGAKVVNGMAGYMVDWVPKFVSTNVLQQAGAGHLINSFKARCQGGEPTKKRKSRSNDQTEDIEDSKILRNEKHRSRRQKIVRSRQIDDQLELSQRRKGQERQKIEESNSEDELLGGGYLSPILHKKRQSKPPGEWWIRRSPEPAAAQP